MLRKVLWVAAACAVLLVALAISRGVRFTSEPARKDAPAVEAAAEPAAAQAPEPAPVAAPITPPDIEQQVAEDAAAVGMTTIEPQDSAAPPQPEAKAPPKLELPPAG